MSRRAFTLVELLVVISIIGLLSSIAVVSMGSSREKARLASGQQFAGSVDHAVGDQIVGQWNFDECSGTTVNDSSGSNNHGTFVGSPTWSTNTPSGKGCSINFNDVANYVSVPDSSTLDLSSNFTISFWVNLNSATSSVFINKGDHLLYGLAPSYGSSGNGFVLPAYNVANTPFIPRRGNDVGSWHHFVGTVNGANVRTMYIDGHFAGTATTTGNSWNNNLDLLIGKCRGYSANALMDEVRVYGGALTALRIQKLYAQESRRYKIALETITTKTPQ